MPEKNISKNSEEFIKKDSNTEKSPEEEQKSDNTEEDSKDSKNNTDEYMGKVNYAIIEDEMKKSYLDYAMSVIVSRALPDVRDGMKPVHRRILYAMNDMGMYHNKAFKKSARIVGEVLGKYHPHGDTSVYYAMVRMAQDFSLRYPLVHGQGNFGSVDGDNPAAMRYTEARMNKLAEEMLKDIDKKTVDMVENFDGSLKEPTVLPAKLPALLINGASGIAVGMATNIPPHNINEVCEGVKTIIDNPECEIEDLMGIIRAPDFPTGATLINSGGLEQAYKTGRGKIKIRSKYKIETVKGRDRIIINEIPYMVNKSMLIEQIANLAKDKKVLGISALRDESDRDGTRVVVEIKKDASAEIVMNQLLKYSRLQVTFGINFLSLVDNTPMTLNLKEMLNYFVEHRVDIITKRTQFELEKAKKRAHILEGLLIALVNIDEIVKKIKASNDTLEATKTLMVDYDLSDIQAKAILDMKLQKLSSLEQEKLKSEHKDLMTLINELLSILNSKEKIFEIIKDEMDELIATYGDKRRTDISFEADSETDMEDLIESEDVVVTISHHGYVKRLSIDTYKQQKRGGRGIRGAATKEEDFIEKIFIANTHSYILFFTDKGKVHWLKVYNIPEASRTSKGKAIVNLISIDNDENVTAYVPIKEFDKNKFLFMTTDKGIVKKTSLEDFSRPRNGGIRAITLEDGENLKDVLITNGQNQIIIATRDGLASKFSETVVRSMGRSARGVLGIRLKGNDKVIGSVIAKDEKTLLTMTENGFGKRTMISEYRLINRGGRGVINIQCTQRNGRVVSVKSVEETDDILLISREGIVIRTNIHNINIIGRNTQGVRLMKVGETDKVISCAKIIADEEEESLIESGENPGDISETEEKIIETDIATQARKEVKDNKKSEENQEQEE